MINAVALWVERGDVTFEAIHIDGAERVARCAAQAGVSRLVHISGLGVETQSPSPFIRARAHGEQAVNALFPQATVFRPSVMFGPDDAFLSSLELATRFPVVPLFGRGRTRLQPVHVNDVAQAATRLCADPAREAELYELGGAQVLTYRQAVETVMRHLDRHRLLLPMPFPFWKAGAAARRRLDVEAAASAGAAQSPAHPRSDRAAGKRQHRRHGCAQLCRAGSRAARLRPGAGRTAAALSDHAGRLDNNKPERGRR